MNAECGVRNADWPDAVRGMIAGQIRVMGASERGLGDGPVEAVHDLRVAIRRIRTLLRAFRKPLAGTGAGTLERRLQRLSKSLGPARDADIWLRFLLTDPAVRPLAARRAWPAFLAREEAARGRRRRAAGRILAGEPSQRLCRDLERFMDSLNPTRRRFAPLAEKALKRQLARVAERSRIGPRFAPGPVHRLRIACRRARYLAEFFGPVLGADVRRLARQMRAVQNVLGDLHDRDVCAARLRRAAGPLPAAAAAALADERRRDLERFRKAWKRVPHAAG